MLQFTANTIIQQTDGREKIWTIPELLEQPEPLDGEPLTVRNEAMRQVVDMAMEMYSDLSVAALLRYDFWKQFKPQRIENQVFKYETAVSNTYQWELTINSEGLFYKDISGEYDARAGHVTEQLFSDFWFYGPCRPLPDLYTRKVLVAAIRNAFIQAGSPASYRHFTLFEYPRPAEFLMQWVEGDDQASDFITVRAHGIEIGRQNWRDGLVYLGFISFEQFIHLPEERLSRLFSTAIRQEIEAFLRPHTHPSPTLSERDREPSGPIFSTGIHYSERLQLNTESKRLFMDNAGQTHAIYLKDNGANYAATPEQEAEWRKELLENYEKRIREEHDDATLAYLARMMKLNGAKHVEQLLYETARNATPVAKQGLAQALSAEFNSEKAADILISLLALENESDYWHNYVFNCFFRMRDNTGVQKFIAACLQGDNEMHFKKSVDVLTAWGLMFGHTEFADRNLLRVLNWEDASANDPDFRAALEKTLKLVYKS